MSKQLSSLFLVLLLLNVLVIQVDSKSNSLKIKKLKKSQSESFKTFTKTKVKASFNFTNMDDYLDIWVKCSDEWGTCNFSGGNRVIRYGLAPNYVYKEFSDGIACNSYQFGDPNPGQPKACYVKNTKVEWVECAGENGNCSFSGAAIVKYGANSSWYYKQVNNSIGCNNGTWGDPLHGTYKRCYFLRDNFWRECAKENGVCRFSGTAIVKYGDGNRLAARQVTDSVECNNSKFGDPAHGIYKSCMVRIGPTFWVQCAGENQACNIPGQNIIRYGANEIFSYKIVEGNINCNNGTFGDPVPGVVKKCSYAVYNVGDEPESLQELEDSVVAEPEEEADVIAHARCSDENGFGFNGMCLSQLFGSRDAGVPTTAKSGLAFVFELLYKISYPFDSCIGDFTGEFIANNSVMSENKCNSIPIIEDFKYGIVAGSVNAVPCGVTPQDISFCALFDRCGTVAIVTNAGLLQCAATYSTGIAAILSPVSDILDFVGFGISVKRRFTKEFEIAHRKGSNTVVSEVTTFGHFYAKIGFSLPLADLKIGGKKVKDFFTLNVECYFLMDFGNAFSVIGDTIASIPTISRSNGKAFLEKILTINSEMTLNIKGEFTLNLLTLTKGFVPDIAINIADASLLISNGNGGASGMNRGIYFYFKRGINNLGEIINLVINQFKSLFSVFGVNLPSADVRLGINIGVGFFISDDSLGFHISGPGFDLSCIYIYEKGGSCSFNLQFFTLLLEGLKYVLKFATQLWDKYGARVLEFAADVQNFTVNAANSVGNFFRNDFRNFFERDVKRAFESAGKDIQNFFVNDVGRGINEAGNAISGFATGAVNATGQFVTGTVGGGIVTAGTAIADTAVSVGKEIENFFSGW